MTEDLDDDDTVLVSPYKSSGKRRFHTNENCRYVTDRHREWRYGVVLAWEIEQCLECSGEAENAPL